MKKATKSIRIPPPPKGLSAPARGVWRRYVEAYDFDPTSLVLLEEMVRWFDEGLKAREILDREGRFIEDRFGQKIQHPACKRDTAAGTMVLKYVRQLGVDLEPLHDGPGRPPGK